MRKLFLPFLQRLHLNGLQARLTLLITLAVAPVLLGMIVLFYARTGDEMQTQAEVALEYRGELLGANLTLWTNALARPLRMMALQGEMLSMESDRQLPLLETLARTVSGVYLASTVDASGVNIARSDGGQIQDYSALPWFQRSFFGSIAADPIAYQTLIEGSGGRSALVVSTALRNQSNEAIGVLMLATDLEGLSAQLRNVQLDVSSEAFVVDQQGFLIAHNNPLKVVVQSDGKLPNWSSEPAVAAFMGGRAAGFFQYTLPETGSERWLAYLYPLPNGWGLVLRQPTSALYAVLDQARLWALGLGLGGMILLLILSWAIVRTFVLRPVAVVNEAAAAVASGDLSRQVPIVSNDEFGQLANTFNSMTAQLRQLVGNLEDRVLERTRSLERRSGHLEAAALVARNAAAIRDMQQLMRELSELISTRFGYYHVGMFLIDDNGEYAVLEAANSEGGQRMLARNHKLRVGQVGIVGYVADTGRPRIALDVGADAVFFNNPDLPATRSEIALPLKISGRVIGVLDAQSTEANAFQSDDVEVLQLMADQIALALESVRLLDESQMAYLEVSALYGERTLKAWQERLRGRSLGYRYNRVHVTPAPPETGRSAAVSAKSAGTLEVPINVAGQKIGSLRLRREGGDSLAWSAEEHTLVRDALAQIAPALENARLLEEIQARAQLESIAGQITSRVQSSLNMDTVLRTIVSEIGLAADLARVRLRLGSLEDGSGPVPSAAGVEDNGENEELDITALEPPADEEGSQGSGAEGDEPA